MNAGGRTRLMGRFLWWSVLFYGLCLVTGCATHTPSQVDAHPDGVKALYLLQKVQANESFGEKLQRLGIEPDEGFVSFWQMAGNHGEPAEAAFPEELKQFVGDSQYRCHRPLLYRYFVTRFGQPAREPECGNDVPFLVRSGIEGSALTWVNPERIKEIHVLFAGRGDGIASRFGHLSFRLVVCPDNSYGDACDENLYEHLVLGYRAHVDDQMINYWSGLTGEYRAHLFANTFMDVYRDYAIGEFRELYSLPLDLSRQQTSQMVRELAEIHWSYSGTYRFVTNNCSSIAQKYLLHSATPLAQDVSLHRIRWRPDRFFKDLRDSQHTFAGPLSNLEEAEREGYYFPSTRPVYEKALALINAKRTDKAASSLEEYLVTPVAARLSSLHNDADYLDRLLAEPRLMEAKRLLEELILIRAEEKLLAELSYYFSENPLESIGEKLKTHASAQQFQAFDRCVIQQVAETFQPRYKVSGIPALDRRLLQTRNKACSRKEVKTRLQEAIKTLNGIDAGNWSRVDMALRQWTGSLEVVSILSGLTGEY